MSLVLSLTPFSHLWHLTKKNHRRTHTSQLADFRKSSSVDKKSACKSTVEDYCVLQLFFSPTQSFHGQVAGWNSVVGIVGIVEVGSATATVNFSITTPLCKNTLNHLHSEALCPCNPLWMLKSYYQKSEDVDVSPARSKNIHTWCEYRIYTKLCWFHP